MNGMLKQKGMICQENRRCPYFIFSYFISYCFWINLVKIFPNLLLSILKMPQCFVAGEAPCSASSLCEDEQRIIAAIKECQGCFVHRVFPRLFKKFEVNSLRMHRVIRSGHQRCL